MLIYGNSERGKYVFGSDLHRSVVITFVILLTVEAILPVCPPSFRFHMHHANRPGLISLCHLLALAMMAALPCLTSQPLCILTTVRYFSEFRSPLDLVFWLSGLLVCIKRLYQMAI